MDNSPPIRTSPPGRKVHYGLLILLFGVIAFGAAVVNRIIQSAMAAADRPQCLSSIKETSMGILIYANEFDDRLPPASRWYDLASHYGGEVSGCPVVARGSLGYAISANLDRKVLAKVEDRSTEVLLFETSQLGFNAIGDAQEAIEPSRHWMNFYSFLDGHVASEVPPR